MAGGKLQFAIGAHEVGFIHKFGAVHAVVAGQVKFHVEHDAHAIQFFYRGHEAFNIRCAKCIPVDADAAVAVRFCKYKQLVFTDALVGVPFAAKGMVYKHGVVLHAGNAAMRIGFITLVQTAQAFAGKIIAGAYNQIAGFYQGLYCADGCKGLINAGIFFYRIFMRHYQCGNLRFVITGRKKNEAAQEPPQYISNQVHEAKLLILPLRIIKGLSIFYAGFLFSGSSLPSNLLYALIMDFTRR